MSVLEEFSEKILSKTRDNIIDRQIDIIEGRSNGITNSKLHEWMSLFPDNQKEFIKKMIIDTVDATFHEFLYNLDENIKFKLVAYDSENNITNMSEEHEENLVGSFLDSIDDYSKYNSAYDIISRNVNLKKEVQQE